MASTLHGEAKKDFKKIRVKLKPVSVEMLAVAFDARNLWFKSSQSVHFIDSFSIFLLIVQDGLGNGNGPM